MAHSKETLHLYSMEIEVLPDALWSTSTSLKQSTETMTLRKDHSTGSLGSFKVAIIDPIIGSIIFTIMSFLEPNFD